jgi:indole-3-glycerol phosphate synthase
VLGINNRNLNTMQVDINTTSRLAELVENKRELVAESGIKTRQDVEKMIRLGVGAVLIGEALCASFDIKAKFNELFSSQCC